MIFIQDFMEKNISVLTLIGIFFGVASFILDLNGIQKDDYLCWSSCGNGDHYRLYIRANYSIKIQEEKQWKSRY